MPARKRGQEAKRAIRRAERHPSPCQEVSKAQAEREIDREWREHQEWERIRRSPLLVTPPQPPRKPPFNIWAVIARVEADFAAWRKERN